MSEHGCADGTARWRCPGGLAVRCLDRWAAARGTCLARSYSSRRAPYTKRMLRAWKQLLRGNQHSRTPCRPSQCARDRLLRTAKRRDPRPASPLRCPARNSQPAGACRGIQSPTGRWSPRRYATRSRANIERTRGLAAPRARVERRHPGLGAGMKARRQEEHSPNSTNEAGEQRRAPSAGRRRKEWLALRRMNNGLEHVRVLQGDKRSRGAFFVDAACN